MLHERESRAMARGSPFPTQSWHRCRRYWKVGLQCAFHGREERKDEDEEETEGHERKDTGREPQRGLRFKEPIPVPPKKPSSRSDGALAEAVPVVARRENPAAVFQEEAFGDPYIRIPNPPAKIPRPRPLYIPDEDIPEWTPPGMRQGMEAVGPSGEEAFVNLLAGGARATPSVAATGAEAEAGFQEYGALAVAFIAMFTSNAVAHLWQTYNARVVEPRADTKIRRPSGTRRPARIQTPFKGRKRPPKTTRPLPQPVKQTVGAGGGRGIIFKAETFQRDPFNPSINSAAVPPSQGSFDTQFEKAAQNIPSYEHLASWQEESFFE